MVPAAVFRARRGGGIHERLPGHRGTGRSGRLPPGGEAEGRSLRRARQRQPDRRVDGTIRVREWLKPAARSEEHTSELQSLMRISYTVFCLNKIKNLTSR